MGVRSRWASGMARSGCMVDSTLDTANSTLTAKISHFSQYALLAPLAPAKFTLSDLKITEDKASPDNPVTIQTTISNEGGSPGSYTAIFKLNSAETNKKEITLEAGKSETVSFTLKNLVPGKYFADINGKTSILTIENPPGVIAEAKPLTPLPLQDKSSSIQASGITSSASPDTRGNQDSESKKLTLPLIWLIIPLLIVIGFAVGLRALSHGKHRD